MCVSSGCLWNRASTRGLAGFRCCDVMGNHLCVCVCVCVSRTVVCGLECRLDVAAWSMEPNVCKPNNRREVQTPHARSAQTESFARCSAGPPVHKLLLSETCLGHLVWLETHTYLHLRTHVRTHSNSLPKKSSCNLSVILTIELERIGEYNQHLHWGFII